MPKPDYATPQRLGELIPPDLVHNALLCPHCNHLLYVGEKSGSQPRARPKRAPRKGASRAKLPESEVAAALTAKTD